MFVYISLALLAVGCVLLAWVAWSLCKKMTVLTADMRVAEALLKCAHDNDVEFDQRLTDFRRMLTDVEEGLSNLETTTQDLGETMAAAEDLIKEHAELEREAANSEKLFQEGLANILSYGVVKNE
jgi:hypothetical protein